MTGRVVALLGPESTGKTTLALAIGETLAARGLDVQVVPEALRAFCDRERRTPRADEQRAIADAQTQAIASAAARAAVVVADTTALMIAVYSDLLFGDVSLYDAALAAQRACALTLVAEIDLPWVADGLQRDGPHVRAPVRERIVGALARAAIGWRPVAGMGAARLDTALAAIDAAGVIRR